MPRADRGAVSITMPQRFDAPDPSRAYVRPFTPAGLCGVPSAERSLSTAPEHPNRQYLESLESDVNMCNAPDAIPTHGVEVSTQLY